MKLYVGIGIMALSGVCFSGGMAANKECNRGSLAFSIEGGYFKQSNVGTQFAVTDSNDDGTTDPAAGNVKSVDTSYKPSYGAHITKTWDNTDANLNILIFRGDNTTRAAANPFLHPLLMPIQWNVSWIDSGSSKFKYRNYFYDVNIGHKFNLSSDSCASNYFIFHPFFGIGAADVKLEQNTHYTGTRRLSTDPVFGGGNVYVYEKSSYSGIGPRIGTDLV